MQLQFPSVHDTVVQSTYSSVHIPIANTDSQKAVAWYCITRFTADDEDGTIDDGPTASLKQSFFDVASDPASK